MFETSFPIIETPDLERALGFYRDLLDGEIDYRFPEEGEPVYVALRIGASEVGIAHAPSTDAGAGGQRFALWVYADSCDAAVERLRAGGVTVTEEPADQEFGERIARVLDPDGNQVLIGERAAS